MKKKIFAANWKLHKSPKETRDFFKDFLSKSENVIKNDSEVWFFPSAICLESAAICLSESKLGSKLKWGSQNCYSEVKGAFTGENSVAVIKELGGSLILIGHSERRSIFGESDELLAKKVKLTQDLDLLPLLCVGETLQQRESGVTNKILEEQLKLGLSQASSQKKLAIAYEPVWAIGTGKVAQPEQVKETHAFVHRVLSDLGFGHSPILYGGSVKSDNAAQLISIDHVDGFLVGGASLEVSSFLEICRN